MKKNYKKYYIAGGILLALGLIIVVVSVLIPTGLTDLLDKNQVIGWIFVAFAIVGLLIIFYASYLLKKANFLKLNQKYGIKVDEKGRPKN